MEVAVDNLVLINSNVKIKLNEKGDKVMISFKNPKREENLRQIKGCNLFRQTRRKLYQM